MAIRLVQLEATHVFGLPGDFNLSLLDEMLTVDGLRWIGSTNELNASYAADGFARVGRRPAAIVTTYGVGELSALNGIAGSYAEDVPVVHVVGMPSRSSMESGTPLHHTFLDGDLRRFERMSREITALQTVVGPGNAAQEIDRVLLGVLETIKPVYVGVPLDVATATVDAAPLDTPLETPGSEAGATTQSDAAREIVDTAPLLVMLGTVHSDFTTGFFTHGYDPASAVNLAIEQARIGRAVYPGVRLEDSLQVLHQLVEESAFEPVGAVPVPAPRPEPDASADDALDQERFWVEIQRWVAPSTTVIAEAGTAFYGALDLRLPPESDLLGQPVWSSSGYTLPAMLGAGLARPDRRPVLFIGDGSAQLTVQELGTAFARGLTPTVFLLNNCGYTVERAIQSPDAQYQDIVEWNWTQVPSALGAHAVECSTVRTVRELRDALAQAASPATAFLIEVMLPRLDSPRLLTELARGISAANSEES